MIRSAFSAVFLMCKWPEILTPCMKQTLLLLFLGTSLNCFSQTELTFDLGAKYVPEEFYWPSIVSEGSWPMLGANVGARGTLGRSDFFWTVGLSYQHARFARSLNFPEVNDPYYGFVRNTDSEIKGISSYNFAGASLGMGWKLKFRRKAVAGILFPLKAKFLFPFDCKRFIRTEDGERTLETPIYPDKYYSKGILYGLNFSPKYQFNFSGRRSDPWRFSAGLQAEYLIRNNTDDQNYFLWGASLGVSYQLQN